MEKHSTAKIEGQSMARKHANQRPDKKHIDSRRWMSYLADDTPMSGLTIPGTHDSASYTSSLPFVATQKLDIQAQLNAGIRYFDFRCGLRDDVLEMVHGIRYLGMRLETVLLVVYDWLEKHQSEALIVQIKEDRDSQRSEVDFALAVSSVLSARSECWSTAPTTRTLGELRGRVQLFRRFIGPPFFAYGIDVTEWMDNPPFPFTINTLHGARITIQDHYTFPSGTTLPSLIRQKRENVAELLDMASKDHDMDHWYLNFVSAYELRALYQITPYEVAIGAYWGFHWEHGMNVHLNAYLLEQGRKQRRYGILAMDFPEQATDDLVTALILKNFEKEKRRWQGAVMSLLVLAVLLILYCCSNNMDWNLYKLDWVTLVG